MGAGTNVSPMPLSFRQSWNSAEPQWGGPPGPRGSPWTRSSFGIDFLPNARGRPGGPPHDVCRRSQTGNVTALGVQPVDSLSANPWTLHIFAPFSAATEPRPSG